MRRARLSSGLRLAIALLAGYVFAVLLPLHYNDMTNLAPLRLRKAVNSLPRFANWAGVQKPWISSATSAISPVKNSPSPHTRRNFTSTTAPTMDMSYKDAVVNRRTIYQLTQESTIPDSRIREIVEAAVTHVPSSFNSQSARLLVLLKDEHTKFWGIVENILKGIVPEASWDQTAQRINGFKNAYGSILFYEDPAAIRKLQEGFPLYADKFPVWSEHTSAMHQYMLWTALETEGLGCNLQHYNPLPDQKVAEIWKVPADWSLKAQLVFGTPAERARESLPAKDQQPLSERLFIHGAS